MTDSPFKPPRLPAGAGHAPIPAVPVAARRRGAIPAAPVQLPRRPVEGDQDEQAEQTDPTNRWAFHYRGNAGIDARGEEEAPEEIPFKPAVELPEAKPLTVLFYQDTQTLQPANVPTSETVTSAFDATSNADGGMTLGTFRLSADPLEDEQWESTIIYVTIPAADSELLHFLEHNVPDTIEVRWGDSYMAFTLDSWEQQEDSGVDYLVLSVTPTDHVINETDGPLEDAESADIVANGLEIPNAAVRARVRYRLGKSEVQFDCDWAGGFQVFADRLELSRVTFAPDSSIPFRDASIEIAATVLADAPRPGGSLALTVPPVAVPTPLGVRFKEFPIHAYARRVNLILKYGDDPDAPGDAPLGQIFLAFVGKFGRSLCYIDAMSAREALFGAGMPIPAGVSKLVVSNRSDDDTMVIGVMWRLEL